MSKLKYFRKDRIQNITAAAVIFITICTWLWVIAYLLDNSNLIFYHGKFVLTPGIAIIMTILGMLNTITGWCLKFFFESDCKVCSRED